MTVAFEWVTSPGTVIQGGPLWVAIDMFNRLPGQIHAPADIGGAGLSFTIRRVSEPGSGADEGDDLVATASGPTRALALERKAGRGAEQLLGEGGGIRYAGDLAQLLDNPIPPGRHVIVATCRIGERAYHSTGAPITVVAPAFADFSVGLTYHGDAVRLFALLDVGAPGAPSTITGKLAGGAEPRPGEGGGPVLLRADPPRRRPDLVAFARLGRLNGDAPVSLTPARDLDDFGGSVWLAALGSSGVRGLLVGPTRIFLETETAPLDVAEPVILGGWRQEEGAAVFALGDAAAPRAVRLIRFGIDGPPAITNLADFSDALLVAVVGWRRIDDGDDGDESADDDETASPGARGVVSVVAALAGGGLMVLDAPMDGGGRPSSPRRIPAEAFAAPPIALGGARTIMTGAPHVDLVLAPEKEGAPGGLVRIALDDGASRFWRMPLIRSTVEAWAWPDGDRPNAAVVGLAKEAAALLEASERDERGAWRLIARGVRSIDEISILRLSNGRLLHIIAPASPEGYRVALDRG